MRRNACPPAAARRWMPPAKGPKTVYVVSRMPPERSGVEWTAQNLGRRKLSVWTAELREWEQWRRVSAFRGGARHMRLSERVPWGRAGRVALRRLHCFYSASFESPTRKFVRGLNSNVSLLHRGLVARACAARVYHWAARATTG